MTGKTCNLPGLIVDNEANRECFRDEAVQKVMKRFMETQEEVRKAEMRT